MMNPETQQAGEFTEAASELANHLVDTASVLDVMQLRLKDLERSVFGGEQPLPDEDYDGPDEDRPIDPPPGGDEPSPPVDDPKDTLPPVVTPPAPPATTPPSGAITVSNRAEMDAAMAAARTANAKTTIVLKAGDYGSLLIDNYHPVYSVVLMADAKHGPHFDRIEITKNASGISIIGMHVHPATVVQYKGPIVTIGGSDCNLEGCLIWPSPDIQNHTGWTPADWLARLHEGIHMTGSMCGLKKNSLLGCGFSSQGDHCVIDQNTVLAFPADAMRCTGNYTTFTRNVAKGCFKVSANHDDGLQVWSTDGKGGRPGTGVLKGLTVVGNEIYERLAPLVQNPLPGPLQGIGMFDGTYEDVTIMGNQIEVTAGHGIALYFALNSTVDLNVVRDAAGNTKSPPKISIRYNQDGPQPYSQHLHLCNNVAPGIFPPASTTLVEVSGNITPASGLNITTVSDLIRHHHGAAKANSWDDFKQGLIDYLEYLAA